MTTAYWCLLVAALMPYATVAMAKYQRGYDNRMPRVWEAGLEGWRQRAVAAHENHFEAFAPFAAAVIVAHLAKSPQGVVDAIAVIFIVARIAYTWAYLKGLASLRSTIWLVGFVCMVALFAVAGATRA